MFDQIDLTWWIEGVTISGVSIIGLFGNFYSLKIYARQKDHRVFHHLLLQLALFDIVSKKNSCVYRKLRGLML